MPNLTLQQLADITGAKLHGAGDCVIHSVASLKTAQSGQLTFLTLAAFRPYLPNTKASVAIIQASELDNCPCHALVTDNPALAYAKAAKALYQPLTTLTGIHASAVINADAQIDPSAYIGPHCTIGQNAIIEANVFIGPNCVIGDFCQVKQNAYLVASVTLIGNSVLGERCFVRPGAVIGSDGFGFANDQGRWVRIPQLGRTLVGDDVEIGACTTIDRGALGDTVIADGVKLDSQVHIAHNVQIGKDTAIAGCAGVAGSAKIGANCTLAGLSGVNGHIELADNVHISGMTSATKSISKAGRYTGTVPALPHHKWRENFMFLKRLGSIVRRLGKLEKLLP